MSRTDVEVEPRNSRGELVEQARPVEAGDFQHRVLVRKIVIDRHFRRDAEGLLIEQIHADLAILGGAGITENGIWNHNALMIAVQRKMIAASERTIFALDGTKFGRKALSLIAPFGPRFTIVTDTRPSPEVIKAINSAGANLTLAESRRSRAQERA